MFIFKNSRCPYQLSLQRTSARQCTSALHAQLHSLFCSQSVSKQVSKQPTEHVSDVAHAYAATQTRMTLPRLCTLEQAAHLEHSPTMTL